MRFALSGRTASVNIYAVEGKVSEEAEECFLTPSNRLASGREKSD